MISPTVAGGGIVFVAAFSLVISFATDAVPANWPLKPVTAEEAPKQFRNHIVLWSCIGVFGMMLLAIGLILGI